MLKLLCVALLASGCLDTGYESIEIAPQAPLELAAFSHLQLHATGVRADGTRDDITDVARWLSTDRQIATVDDSGTLQWVAAGYTHICVFVDDVAATVVLTANDPVPAP